MIKRRPPKELSAKEVAYAKSDFCIFCGGTKAYESVDHQPPKGIFSNKQWPEGYVFPACNDCNQGSKDEENLVALLARTHSVSNITDATDLAELDKLLSHFWAKKPEVMKAMRINTRQARQAARRLHTKPVKGQLYRDLPYLNVPSDFDLSVKTFAVKLAKALHFECSQKIVPVEGDVWCRWFTNANKLEGKLPPEIFSSLNGVAAIRRGKKDLTEQFFYLYECAPDGQLGMYTAMLRNSFCVYMVVALDGELIRRIKDDVLAMIASDETNAKA